MKRLLIPALASVFLTAALTPGLALAQTGPQPASAPLATTLSLNSSPAVDGKGRKLPGQLILSATVATANGKLLNNRTVDFYQQVDLMGPRKAYIGSAVTDSTGVAALRYESAQSGEQDLLATFAGTAEFSGQEAAKRVSLAESGSPFKGEPLPLASVGRSLAIAVGLLGLAVWIVLLGIFARTVIGIRAAVAAAGAPSKEIPMADVLSEIPVGGAVSNER